MNITAVSVSILKAQATSSSPEVIQRSMAMCAVSCPKPTRQNTIQDSTQEVSRKPVVISSEARTPMRRPNSPAMRAPSPGRNTMAE